MNKSIGLTNFIARCNYFKKIRQDSLIRKEYLVLNLLQFAKLNEKEKTNLATEIVTIRRLLQTKCLQELDKTELMVTDYITKTNLEQLTQVNFEYVLELAEKLATDSKAHEVALYHLFHVLFEEDMFPLSLRHIFNIKPKTEIKEILDDKGFNELKNVIENLAKEKEEKAVKVKEKEENAHSLLSLNERIKDMSEYLLSKVKGQDQAISTLSSGYWNAEILNDVDTERVRPKATFLFAGPPGVGKTYMAKEMAKYLGLKFHTIDMSKCSDDQIGVMTFQGSQKTWKDSKPGELVTFVHENPKCVLLFDEIEKAHLNVLYLFYQILDQGVLYDLYREKNVSFKDVIIIMTTNVGHNLYEGKEEENLSLIPKKKIIQALEKDENPLTKKPFFPTALVSRMASGNVLMFNHLQYHNLVDICRIELNRQKKLFEKQYQVNIEFDEKIPSLLLYKEGGICDARSLTGQTKLFFTNSIYHFVQLYKKNENDFADKIKKIHFTVEDWDKITQLDNIFKKQEKEEILIFNNDILGNSLKGYIPEYSFSVTSDSKEASKMFEKKDFQMVLVDMFAHLNSHQNNELDSFNGLGAINIKASIFDEVRKFVGKTLEDYPYMPIYVLEKQGFDIDDQLLQQLIELGIRGKMSIPGKTVSAYKQQIEIYLERAYLQTVASNMISKRKMIQFDVSSLSDEVNKCVYLRCRNYELADMVDVGDDDFIVSDAERPTIKFNDVIGASSAKQELKFFMNYLQDPKKFLAKGLKPPKGILFYGPPGTGKTMLAKAMAGESDITFISESASNIISNPSMNGSEAIRNMFERARKYAPAILFIDEIDAIGRTRTGVHVSAETSLNTLLTELDGFKVNLRKPVFLIAATNFSIDENDGNKSLDSALVRRFDRQILIDLPSRNERYELLKMLCSKLSNCSVTDETLQNIASRSLGLSNAILSNVVNTAARDAEQKGVQITDEFFIEAFELTVHGEVKDWGIDSLERTAFHEAGHAYMYWKNGQTPSYLTIVARGNHGGYMQRDEDEATAPIKTRKELLRDIRVSLAGRASEIVRYGNEDGISTGISGDLRQASRVAKYMLSYYGMDDDFGFVYIDENMMNSSEMTLLMHQKISTILKEQMQVTINELQADFKRVEKLANALIEKTSMTGDEIKAVLEGLC